MAPPNFVAYVLEDTPLRPNGMDTPNFLAGQV